MSIQERGIQPYHPLLLEDISLIVGSPKEGAVLYGKRAEVLSRCRTYLDDNDYQTVEKAVDIGIKAHGSQIRVATGHPYMMHCLRSMSRCADRQANSLLLTTLAVHDVTEDTSFTLEDIRNEFGDRIHSWVSSLQKVRMKKQKTTDLESARKIVYSLFPEIILGKAVERLDNYEEPKPLDPNDIKAKADFTRKAWITLTSIVPALDYWGARDIADMLADRCLEIVKPKFIETVTKVRTEKNDPNKQQRITDFALEQIRQEDPQFGSVLPLTLLYELPSNYEVYRRTKGHIKGAHLTNVVRPRLKVVYTTMEDALATFSKLVRTGRFVTQYGFPLSDFLAEDYTQHDTGVLKLYSPENHFDLLVTYLDYLKYSESLLWEICRYKPDPKAIEIQLLKKPAWQDLISSTERSFPNLQQQMGALAEEIDRPKIVFYTPDGKEIAARQGTTGQDAAFYIYSGYLYTCLFVLVNGDQQPLDKLIPDGSTVEVVLGDTNYSPRRLEQSNSPSALADIRRTVRKILRSKDYPQHEMVRRETIAMGAEVLKVYVEELVRAKRIPYIPKDSVIGKIAEKFQITQKWEDLFIKAGLGEISKTELNNTAQAISAAVQKFLEDNLIVIDIIRDHEGIIGAITTEFAQLKINIDDYFNQGSQETGDQLHFILSLNITPEQKVELLNLLEVIPDIKARLGK